MITLTIDNRVRISGGDVKALPTEILDSLKKICTHKNPEWLAYQSFRRGYEPPEWLASWKREDRGALSFPRGRHPQMVGALASYGVQFKSVFHVTDIPAQFVWKGPELWESQQRLNDSYTTDKGIWRSPPGSGKTNAALYAVYQLKQRTLIVAPTEAVFKQWVDRTKQFLGIEPGIIQQKKRTVRDVTIASQRTLWNCASEYADQFGFLIVDEAQKAASRTYQDAIDLSTAKYRLAVSGDERRADGRQVLIYDQFGEHIEEVTKQECYEAGTLVEVEIRVLETSFRFDKYRDLPAHIEKKLRYTSHARRNMAMRQHRFDTRHELDEAMIEDEQRNALIVRTAKRCLEEGQHVIALSKRREHCMRLDAILSSFAPTVRFIGDDDDFEESRDRFARGEVKCAVGTYQKIGVGFESHRELARGIFTMPVSVSDKEGRMQFEQFLGRFARAASGKTKAVVYYLHDQKIFGDKPVKLIASWAKNVTVQTLGGKVLTAAQYLKKRSNETPPAETDPVQSELFRSRYKR